MAIGHLSDTPMTHPESLVARPDLRRMFAPLLLLLGCGHTEPFASIPSGTDQPFDATPPIRLTLNQGPDRGATWLPDGSGILYSAQQLGRRDRDVCFAVLPPTGGRQRQMTCDLSPAGRNLTDALESFAAAPDGRLAFLAASSSIGATSPDQQGIVLGSVDDPINYRVLQPVPYALPGDRLYGGVSQLQWLSSNRVLYLGERVLYYKACLGCPLDTLRSGLDATWLAVDEVDPSPQRILGTENASGVSTGSNENEVYYTLGGDTRVFLQSLSDGAVSVVHDFASAGIARDVHVMGNRIAVVVGGRVAFGTDPLLGTMQWDSGGVLHVVDLQAGTDVTLDGPGLFRRPQISPSGSAIVAEGYSLIVTQAMLPGGEIQSDTTVSERGDLFLFGQP